MDGRGLPPELMKEHNIDILLCNAIGSKAVNLCTKLGIKVYVHDSNAVKELLSYAEVKSQRGQTPPRAFAPNIKSPPL